METSPLRFLDCDVSLMLADQVRISQQDYARKYHHNLYQCRPSGGWHGRHTVHYHHGIICLVLNRLRNTYGETRAGTTMYPWTERQGGSIIRRPVKPLIIIYEQEVKNIRRQPGPVILDRPAWCPPRHGHGERHVASSAAGVIRNLRGDPGCGGGENKFALEFYYEDSNVYNFKIAALVLTPLVFAIVNIL
jgi:hypothetical protein